MKKILCLLLAFAFLFSLAACTPTEGETSDEPGTSAPAESTAPTESGNVTGSEESTTQPETATQWTVIVPPADGEEFILNEDQLPTITTIDFHGNRLTSQNPTEEEVANFLCEYYFYFYIFRAPYNCIYMIPPTETQTIYTGGHDGPYYRLDPAYIKSKSYMESVVSSYLDYSCMSDGLFVVADWVDGGDPEDLYTVISDYERRDGCDPSLLNFSVDKREENIIELTVYLYYYYEAYKDIPSYAKVDIEKIQLTYLDGMWRVTSPFYSPYIGNYPAPIRDDFGKRLTLVKPD